MEIKIDKNQIKYTQNFLTDKDLVKRIIDKADIGFNDFVLEIGPGKGILTDFLKQKAKRVLAIEKDSKLFKNLCEKYKNDENVKIINEDFLKHNLPKESFKIFSNIPFNITAQIFDKIKKSDFFKEGYLIVQKEYAEKICGYPYFDKNQKDSLLTKYEFDVKILYEFKKEDFSPKPSVNTVLLSISRKEKQKNDQKDKYFDFISYIFLQGKKNVKTALRHIFTSEQLKRLSSQYFFDINKKPTEISFEKWTKIFDYYVVGVEERKKERVKNSFKKLNKTSKNIEKIHRTFKKRLIK
jgi:23S rRNA (adenine-N6)-dimethyltransferase